MISLSAEWGEPKGIKHSLSSPFTFGDSCRAVSKPGLDAEGGEPKGLDENPLPFRFGVSNKTDSKSALFDDDVGVAKTLGEGVFGDLAVNEGAVEEAATSTTRFDNGAATSVPRPPRSSDGSVETILLSRERGDEAGEAGVAGVADVAVFPGVATRLTGVVGKLKISNEKVVAL